MPHMTRQTANIILYRQGKGLEVFLVSRSRELRFLGGYLAFAGGKTESGDETLPLDEEVDAGQRTLLGCAVRELFEETGVLALRNSSLSKKDTASLRRKLLQGGAAGFFSSPYASENAMHSSTSRWAPAQPTLFRVSFG